MGRNQVVVSFKGHDDLYKALLALGEKEFRTPSQMILYYLSKNIPITKEFKLPVAPAPGNNTVTLYRVPNSYKIHCIKAVRACTGLMLKEAKDIVDALPEKPYTIVENVSALEAEKVRLMFRACEVEDAINIHVGEIK